MLETHQETIDYQPDTLVDGQLMPLIVMESRGRGQDKQNYKKIEAPPDSMFFRGSKVECFGLKWLVIDKNYNEEVKLSGEMQLCNFPLKWQDDDYNIVEEWCVVTRYKTAASGEDAGKVITVDDTRRNVFIQFNEKTAKLYQGKRFFIDLEGMKNLKPYKLTDLDRTSYIYDGKGFFSLVCTEEQEIGDRDRPDLMICDYQEPPIPSPAPIGLCEITYSSEPILKIGGSTKRFTAIFKDNDSNPITTITPTWEIIPNELVDQNQIVILSELDNEIRLEATDKAVVGTQFELKVSGEGLEFGYFECEIVISIEDLW